MRTIKKYGNRRLYDTSTSAYVNLGQLATLIRSGETLTVLDAGTGEDLTRSVLLQVLVEENGADALPVSLLHRMIRFGGDAPLPRAALKQLGVGFELLEKQLAQAEIQWPWLKTPMTPPPPASSAAQAPPPEPEPEADPVPVGDPELDALRARLAELEKRLRK